MEYGPDHEVPLIIKPLNDDSMIRVMSRENLTEWQSSATVEHETIRAVVLAFAAGKIELPDPDPNASPSNIRYAPSFIPGKPSVRGTDAPYTMLTVARYLRWTVKGRDGTVDACKKVRHAIWALELVEQRLLTEDQFTKLTTTEAAALVKETRRIRDEAAEEAVRAAEKAKKAEEEARTAGVDLAKAKAAGKTKEAEAAQQKVYLASKKAVTHKKRAVSAAREGLERAHSVGAKLAKGLQAGEVAAKQVKQKARDLETVITGKKAKNTSRPNINKFAKRLQGTLSDYFQEEDGPRGEMVKKIRYLIRFRADLEKGLRTDLISELRRIGRITDELATALKA